MKITKWMLTLAPVLMVAGMQTAQAGNWDPCTFFPWFCTSPHDGNGPVSVPEPEMIALFSSGFIVAGLTALRRRKRVKE
jgi:hypothetical protein